METFPMVPPVDRAYASVSRLSLVVVCRVLLILHSKHLGLITDDATDKIRQTFEHAIAVVNSDLSVPLVGETQQVDYGNSVQAFSQLCQLMQVRNSLEY